VLRQNLAFLDRFRVVQVSYPDAQTEQGLIKTLVPSLPEAIGEKMVDVANEVRRLFLGQANTGQELTVTLSTRTLVRWARLALTFKGAPQPLAYTLDQALTARAEPEQREAIHRIAADVFGSLWTGTAP
jgi:cobaltochelatase CobS